MNDRLNDQNGPAVPQAQAVPVGSGAEMAKCHVPADSTTGNDTALITPPNHQAVFIGLDTEWVKDPKRKFRNVVLAYGLCILFGGKVSKLIVEPKGPERRHRYSLKRLIGRAIQKAVGRGVLEGWPSEVYLAVHYGRGDLAACSGNRGKIRGSPALFPCADSAPWILCIMCCRQPPFPR